MWYVLMFKIMILGQTLRIHDCMYVVMGSNVIPFRGCIITCFNFHLIPCQRSYFMVEYIW